jgi:hypothetical protein
MAFKHIMVDLETLGKPPYAPILSIAAVEFDIETGETRKSVYTTVKKESFDKYGIEPDPDTVAWWEKQSEEARKEAFSGYLTIENALILLANFFDGKSRHKVWANSPSFDLNLLKNLYQKIGEEVWVTKTQKNNNGLPWYWYNEQDVRTYNGIFPSVVKNMPFEGVAHNALEDCNHQIKCLSTIYNIIHNNVPDSALEVDRDGVTHINIYSKGNTDIGRYLSNFAHTPIELKHDGYFASIEAYWYWLLTGDDDLRLMHGFSAKAAGKTALEKQKARIDSESEEFKEKIKHALDVKFKSHSKKFLSLCQSHLPLRHYYVYQEKRVDAGYKWITEHIEKRRQETIKHFQTLSTHNG